MIFEFQTEIELTPLSQQILSALPSQIAVMDAYGTIIAHNQLWSDARASATKTWSFPQLGENILRVLQHPLQEENYSALQLMVAYKAVLNGEKRKVTIQFEANSTPSIWYSLSISCLEPGTHFLIVCEDVTTTITARKTLKEHNLKFQHQFENRLYGTIIADHNLQIKDSNQAACTILNSTKNDLTQLHLTQLLHVPVHLPQNVGPDYVSEIFLGESSLRAPDGHHIPVELNISHYSLPDGEQALTVIFKDITKKNEAEAKLCAEQAFVNASIDSLPTPYFVINNTGTLIRWNNILQEELGYSADELREMKISQIIHPSEYHVLRANIKRAKIGDSVNVEARCKTKSGSDVYYLISGTWFEQDGERFIVGGGINRNDSKQVELESQRNELFFTQLFEKSQVGMVMLGLDGTLKKCNPSFEMMMGYTQSELQNTALYASLVPENRIAESLEILRYVGAGKITEMDTVRIHKQGTEVNVQLSHIPITVNGEVIATFGVYVDLTQQEEGKKIIRNQLHEKEVLIQEIHHRVKNNMAIISGIIELEGLNTNVPSIREHLYKTLYRIQSISKIHEVMYKNKDLTSINFDKYLLELSTNFQNRNLGNIEFECSPNLVLNVNQAIPTGMLINEITNQVASFYNGKPNSLCNFQVRVNEEQQIITLHLSLPKEAIPLADIVFDTSISAELISVIITQLEAEVSNKTEQHVLEIVFKMNPNQRGAHNALL